MLFVDLNYPGVVYEGTQAHFDGLIREGGAPFEVASVAQGCKGDDAWVWQKAPDHWVTEE